jgi:peptidoglycan/LPS O-acetylase OafA/YrhL/lysophospholipase L1-like esterase
MDRVKEHRPALDGLRAVAVMAVILYHLGLRWLPGGYLGVDLFFVLSGYLITGTLLPAGGRGRHVDLAAFWSRRARRLLPALLVMLAGVALAVRQWEPASEWHLRSGELIGALLYYANWHMIFGGQSYFDTMAAPSPLQHMWSLAIEEQFYLLWPLVVFVVLRWCRRRSGVLIGVAAVAGVASAIAMVVVYSPADPTRAYAGTDARAQQLLVGALLFVAVRRHQSTGRWVGVAGLAAMAVSIGALFVVPDSGGFYYRGGATVVALVFAALIWSVERAPDSVVARALSFPPVAWIGLVSYGLYLWHIPVIRFLPVALPIQLPPVAMDAAEVAVAIGLAALSYYLVERPVRYGRLRYALEMPRHTAAAAAGAVAACTLMVLISTTWATGMPADQLASAARAALDGTGPDGPVDGTPVDRACPDTRSICVRVPAPEGHRTIAVLGDSVARSLDPGFLQLAETNGWGYVLAAHNGCGLTGLVNTVGGQPKPYMRKCAEETPDRIRRVVDDYHPNLVISLSRWEVIAHLDSGEHQVEPMSAQWSQDVHAGLRTFAQTVVQSGATLVMLAVMPQAPPDPRCVKDPGSRGCWAPPDRLTAAANRIYEQVQAEVPGVRIVSMQDAVCPGARCRSVVAGMLLRYDGDHFTEDGARWFVRQLAPRLP